MSDAKGGHPSVCLFYDRLQRDGKDLPISINISRLNIQETAN